MKTVLQTTSATLAFTPGAAGVGTINFSQVYNLYPFSINRLMAIINQTRNKVIFAEGQPNLGWTNWNQNTNILTLGVDTTSHDASDSLQVIYDTATLHVAPAEEYYDAVNKSRVSTPQSLIDTDFEYSVQPTKWEVEFLTNNKPAAFYIPSEPFDTIGTGGVTITDITGNGTRLVTVTFSTTTPTVFRPGLPIYIQDTLNPNTNGWFVVNTVSSGGVNNITFYTDEGAIIPVGSVVDIYNTLLFPATFYSGAGIPVPANAFTFSGGSPIITCTTSNAHGLYAGNLIYITGSNSATANVSGPTLATTITGSQVIVDTPNATTFRFVNPNGIPSAGITNPASSAILYPRPAGYSIQRAFDGGIQFSTGIGGPNSTIIRQTRKYFRYQSGKGIQFSTGSTLKPSFQINTVVATSLTPNALVVVTTKVPHGCRPGTNIIVSGSDDNAFNGNFEVESVYSDVAFTYRTISAPSVSQAPGFPLLISPSSNYGTVVRIGMFDRQNGIFFENDGVYTYVVRRSSTQQLAGLATVAANDTVVNGVGTLFAQQLSPGDWIVIKGMSYKILSIESNTVLQLTSRYRSTINATNAVISKTIDTKIRQDQWNIDTMDGHGPSGFALDSSKMQMFYIDYSWYGAGFVRWGFRAQNGNVYICHKMINNNINQEAYMRSGNLPARYEQSNENPTTLLTDTLSNTETNNLSVLNVSIFPSPSGIVCLRQPGNTSSSQIEYITYTNVNSLNNTLNNLLRAQPGGNSTPQTFTYSTTAPIPVELIGQVGSLSASNTPPSFALSHWGSSVIMDGRYDDDFNFVFNAGNNTQIALAGGIENLLLAIRLAPSVDNGRVGQLGVREILNRMSLRLRSMDSVASGAMRVSCVLNARVNSSISFTNVGGSSLAQAWVASGAGTTITGGENIFSFFVGAGATSQDLSVVRELGNSIDGGGTNLVVPQTSNNLYPDGPDILYITARNVTGGSLNVSARISWTEAQA